MASRIAFVGPLLAVCLIPGLVHSMALPGVATSSQPIERLCIKAAVDSDGISAVSKSTLEHDVSVALERHLVQATGEPFAIVAAERVVSGAAACKPSDAVISIEARIHKSKLSSTLKVTIERQGKAFSAKIAEGLPPPDTKLRHFHMPSCMHGEGCDATAAKSYAVALDSAVDIIIAALRL